MVSNTSPIDRSSWNTASHSMKQGALIVFDPETLSTGAQLAGVIRRYSSVLLPGAKELEGSLRFFSIGYAPLAISNIYTASREIIKNAPEKMDNKLTLISETGALIDVAALIADGLDTFELIANSGAWVDPLYITGAVLSTAGIVLNVKGIYETHSFSNKLKREMRPVEFDVAKIQQNAIKANAKINNESGEKYRTDSYKYASIDDSDDCASIMSFENGVKLIKQKHKTNYKFVTKHFESDGNKFADRMDEISRFAARKLASPLPHKVEEGRNDMSSTKELLYKKLTNKKWSNAFKILTAVISLIGFGLLFSPFAPAGLVLLGLSGIMSISHRLYNRRKHRQFEEALKIR